ncbi:MAG: NADH-quinone oxidoreductase subunit L [Deltaproteobacteria bacterium]|nr:NADH-quinone oxidoreductase subunit L [Deltaproteobacteria bacterium]
MDPSLTWLVPLLPLLAGVVGMLLPLSQRRLAFGLAVGALGASALISIGLLLGAVQAGGEAAPVVVNFTWLSFGGSALKLGFVLNPLTAVMIAMVSFVALLIFIFSHGYMHDDRAYARFFAFLSLFCAGMLGLCVANSLVLLFLAWEIVGVSSYLLIGFWHEKPSAAAAAKKAFLVTKLGDLGFLVGILWLYGQTGTQLLFDDGFGVLEDAQLQSLRAATGVFFGMNLAGVLALLIFCGAIGKSGQFPLHVWLPDAMEGPTPVSALIHAATMVAAGVFLVARTYPLFAADPMALDVVAWVGSFTALLAATIAVAQRDIKRILAYSTVSQLGFMMLGLAVGGVAVGMFHLITHAFFKALLFLGAGSVIHGSHHQQDIFKMGGLRGPMKTTFVTYLVGTAALAGVVPFAGFWSKDEILLSAWHQHAYGPFALTMVASFLTAFYMTRQVALVFFGANRNVDEHGHAHHAHESPLSMTAPLMILAVFAAGIGLVGTPWANLFGHFLEPRAEHAEANLGFMAVATVVALAGIGAGWALYGRLAPKSAGDDPLARVQPLYRWLEHRWYFDELYATTVVRLLRILAQLAELIDALLDLAVMAISGGLRALAQAFFWTDEHLVRPAARLLAAAARVGGGALSRLQTGRVQRSLSAVTFGATVLLGLLLLVMFAR